jgi:hypothetical protein
VDGVSVRKIPIRRLVLAGVRGFTAKFVRREHSFPSRFAKMIFGSGYFLRQIGGLRNIRKPRFARRPIGFPRVSMSGVDRCRPGLDWRDSGDD